MIIESSLIAANWKLASGGLAVIILAAADVVTPPQSIEDYSIKALMGVVIIFMVRLLLTQQKEHKQEMKDERDKHELRMETVIKENTTSNQQVVKMADEQMTYFKTVTRSIVDEHLRGPRTPLP